MLQREDRESHKLAWLQFLALRHHSKRSTLERSPAYRQQDFSRHFSNDTIRTVSAVYSVFSQACFGVKNGIQTVLSNESTEGDAVYSLLAVDEDAQIIFLCAHVFVPAGCGRTLFSPQVVRLLEYRLAACGFVLYPLSPEIPVPPSPPPLRLGVISHFIWVWSWSSLPRWPLSVIDSVRFCSAMSRARVIVCCPL